MRKSTVPALLLLAGCFSGYSDPPPAETLEVRRARFERTAILSGELEAARGEILSVPRLPSWQTSIKWIAEDGTAVRAGERVIELDNSAFTAQLDQRRQNELQSVQELQQRRAEWSADLEQRQLDVEKRRAELEKAQLDAVVPREVLSEREYEDRQTRLRRASVEHEKTVDLLLARRVAIESDERNLLLRIDRARREIAEAEVGIEALLVRAPTGGFVVVRDHPWEGRRMQVGDTVWVGVPVAMIPDPSSLRVLATLSDVDDGRIAVGQRATVTLDGYPAKRYGASIRGVSAVARESRRQSLRREFQVDVALDTLDPALMRPGLSAKVEVQSAAIPDALLVPRAAIDLSGKEPQVRTSAGRAVSVKLGPCNAFDCVALEGVKEGDALLPVLEVTHG
ncbi:MAG: HlyD family efflux transporter periplasmic adaptor subunit [Thermoanaerobaculia bacterium]